MPKIEYVPIRFSSSSLKIIERANQIISEYTAQGFDLTLRQLYYQFVSRDLIANKQQEYKRLGSIINDARLAGLIDWDCISDRTRNLRSVNHWKNPRSIIRSAADCFRIDKWANQPCRVEVWIEKDALLGVIEDICNEYGIGYFSCRGYVSQSEMWAAAQRIEEYNKQGQRVVLLHLGDHDPSGIDMSRDIRERLEMFTFKEGDFELKRIALNQEQIDWYGPPPNPAKTTDSRYENYIKVHGDESWELDALEPSVLVQLIRDKVTDCMDDLQWAEDCEKEEEMIEGLKKTALNWEQIEEFVEAM